MKLRVSVAQCAFLLTLCAWGLLLLSPISFAQQGFVVQPVAEKKVTPTAARTLVLEDQETFPRLRRRRPLRVQRRWRLKCQVGSGFSRLVLLVVRHLVRPRWPTLGRSQQSVRPEYMLRINHAFGPPGAKTRVHDAVAGSETFYVLTGELSQKGPHRYEPRRGSAKRWLDTDLTCPWKCQAAVRITSMLWSCSWSMPAGRSPRQPNSSEARTTGRIKLGA